MRVAATGTVNQAQAEKMAQDLEKAMATKYQPNQDRLLPQAKAYEEERDRSERRHRGMQVTEAAFQIAIVLSSVAIVARQKWLMLGGGALGLIGLLGLMNGFYLWVDLPV